MGKIFSKQEDPKFTDLQRQINALSGLTQKVEELQEDKVIKDARIANLEENNSSLNTEVANLKEDKKNQGKEIDNLKSQIKESNSQKIDLLKKAIGILEKIIIDIHLKKRDSDSIKLFDAYLQEKKIAHKSTIAEHKQALEMLSENSSKKEINKFKAVDIKYAKEEKEIKQLEDYLKQSNQEQREIIISIIEQLKSSMRDLN